LNGNKFVMIVLGLIVVSYDIYGGSNLSYGAMLLTMSLWIPCCSIKTILQLSRFI